MISESFVFTKTVMKKSYQVTIMGQKFILKTEHDENHVKRIADYVNRVMHGIKQKAQTISTQNVAILGALNIAEEMFDREEGMKDLVHDWKERLIEAVPQCLLNDENASDAKDPSLSQDKH